MNKYSAKKSLGQNFLRSQGALRMIVSAGKVKAGDIVLEIGPGRGALTAKLLEAGAKVIAIEKDRLLIPILTEKFQTEIAENKLKIIEGDILEMSAKEIFPHVGHVGEYKLIANIPYYITGAVVRKFLEEENQPSLMVLLLQKEVAERIVVRDGKASILSMAVKAYSDPRYVGKVERKAFSPVPNVDSAIVAFENISKRFFTENKIEEKEFFEIMKAGFAAKRKKLSGNLKKFAERLNQKYFEEIKDKRAEELTISDWKKLLQI
ncbi:MAG: 16S rRNA (adenine(1518)-N(6)/adenine(1519)-N(6))-dimethyltransferase RsmA [Patescibacteria group bacterium]